MSRDTIVIKGVERRAYRRFKSIAAKEGLTMGEAASRAFISWSAEQPPLIYRIRDTERMRSAAETMDRIRSKQKIQDDWSSERVIREWRNQRH